MDGKKSLSLKSQKTLLKQKKLSLAMNMLIAFLGITSLYMKFFVIDGLLAFRAFTVNGNLFTTLITIVAVFINIGEIKSKKNNDSKLMFYLMLASAVTEAVIFIVVMIGYLPFVPDKPAVTPYHMFCLHVAIPILSVLRFIFLVKPLGILKPVNLLYGAIPIGVYGFGVTVAIKLGVLPIVLVPYSFLDFDNNFIWYFLFALFVIPAFGYLWSWMFYRLNIRASVLWFNETDVRNFERARIKAASRFDVVNSIILMSFCGLGLLLLSITLMLTSNTSTKIQHELLRYTSFYMIDDFDSKLGAEPWSVKDGGLYKGNILIGDGTEKNANYDILPDDVVIFDCTLAVKASDLSPEIAAKYDEDDYVVVTHSSGNKGFSAKTGDVISKEAVNGVYSDEDYIYCETVTVEEKITDPLYKSEYRKYFEEEKKNRKKFFHFVMGFGSNMYEDPDVAIISMYIPVDQITVQAKTAEMNMDITMAVIIIIIFTALYLMTIRWIKGLEASFDYLRELADDRIPDEPLNLGRGKRLKGLEKRVNKVRKRKLTKLQEAEED